MKLQFEPNQQYQLAAIQSVVDVFAGQPQNATIEINTADFGADQLSIEAVSARGNHLQIANEQLAKNVREIQGRNELAKSELVGGGYTTPYTLPAEWSAGMLKDGRNFTVEMETGTGKTYVYLRTIHELRQNYGWKKFIIVVPSVAIREGVLKNLEITREHFNELYEKPEMNYCVWDSKKTGQAREFATNDTLQIMVITIDSFAKSQNIMNKQSDYGRPLDYIRATNPVVIIDEPQNMETEIRGKAIENLNPLCTLRYSATHKNPYNMLYRLTPVDAYDQGLVKKIEVHSVMSEDSYNDAYISVQAIERAGKSRLLAKVEIDASDERGLQRKVIKIAPGDDLEQLTKRAIYRDYIVDAISFDEKAIEFTNGKTLYVGQRDEGLHDEIIKRQIELTIEDHFEKQKRLNAENVKVLSLFFIDKVANYREYSENGFAKGKFAVWFEELFAKIAAKPKFAGVMDELTADQVHDGYFAADKNKHWKDSRDAKGEGGRTKDDDGAYAKIMRDKEKLLSQDEPLRFIFSHSALREGWDNPNVFQICTLNETSSEMKKRQEIGRGLRLPVNANGERVRDENINILTVIANESYDDFSRKLQTEIEDETGILFGGRIKKREDRKRVALRKNVTLDPAFRELWGKIQLKTTYRVNIDIEKLVRETVDELSEVTISRPQIAETRTSIDTMTDGFKSRETSFNARSATAQTPQIPDLLESIQNRTFMTRKIIFNILDQSKMFAKVPVNPQQVIDEVSWAINRVKHRLAINGIKYEKTGQSYAMELFENRELEAYMYNSVLRSGAVEVRNAAKTVYDYVAVDSGVEYDFLQSLEDNEAVRFYIKLPSWFKIDTPVGAYNPDWAVVFDGDERIYFVAETKGADSLNDKSLRTSEVAKIKASRAHFATIDVKYVAPVESFAAAVLGLSNQAT